MALTAFQVESRLDRGADRINVLESQVGVLQGVVLELRRDVNRLKAKAREVEREK
jgi:hypothetical protein